MRTKDFYDGGPVAPGPGQVSFAPSVPIDSEFARHRAALERQRSLDGARDLRSQPRRSADRVWERLKAECEARFGRAPSAEPHEQPGDEAGAALARAHRAEAHYLGLAGAGGSKASLDVALDTLCGAVADWVNLRTRGWPSRKRYEAEQQRRAAEPWEFEP